MLVDGGGQIKMTKVGGLDIAYALRRSGRLMANSPLPVTGRQSSPV
jgi:hypothetical protein